MIIVFTVITRCLAAYAVAVVVSSQSALLFIQAASTHDHGMPGFLDAFPAGNLLALMMTGMYSLLPAFAAIALAEVRGWRHPAYFAVTGALTAAAALSLEEGSHLLAAPDMLLPCMTGGLLGGLAYIAVLNRMEIRTLSTRKLATG